VGQIFTWRALIEIALLAVLIYPVLAFLHGTRGAGIVRGVTAVLVIVAILAVGLAGSLKLPVLDWIITNVLGYLVIALIVIFQPELRSVLLRVGQSPVFTSFIKERWDVTDQIAKAVMALARERTGALLAIQRSVGLKTYTEGGVRLDAAVSAELLMSVFKKGSPLHDGAVIIRGDRVVAAACLFPLSENPNLDTSLGTRHRAAVGLAEECDAVAIVVSEETGDVSIAHDGSLTRKVDAKTLAKLLRAISSEEGFQARPVKELA